MVCHCGSRQRPTIARRDRGRVQGQSEFCCASCHVTCAKAGRAGTIYLPGAWVCSMPWPRLDDDAGTLDEANN